MCIRCELSPQCQSTSWLQAFPTNQETPLGFIQISVWLTTTKFCNIFPHWNKFLCYDSFIFLFRLTLLFFPKTYFLLHSYYLIQTMDSFLFSIINYKQICPPRLQNSRMELVGGHFVILLAQLFSSRDIQNRVPNTMSWAFWRYTRICQQHSGPCASTLTFIWHRRAAWEAPVHGHILLSFWADISVTAIQATLPRLSQVDSTVE